MPRIFVDFVTGLVTTAIIAAITYGVHVVRNGHTELWVWLESARLDGTLIIWVALSVAGGLGWAVLNRLLPKQG